MKNNTLVLFFVAILFIAVSCKKSKNNPPVASTTAPTPDVYVAGDIMDVAGYSAAISWKNGIATRLPADSTASSSANAIGLIGTDVYVAGLVTGANNITIAVLWKNGALITKLSDGKVSTMANAMAISGNDIYVAGNVFDANNASTAVYWKNGVLASAIDSSSLSSV